MADSRRQLHRKIIMLRIVILAISVSLAIFGLGIAYRLFSVGTTSSDSVVSGNASGASSNISGGESSNSSGGASFSGQVVSIRVINPATVSVDFDVSNMGSGSGEFTCTVNVSDPSGTYRGFDYFTDNLGPGETQRFTGELTVTNEGAAYADSSSITC
jgi:hypothetical protein